MVLNMPTETVGDFDGEKTYGGGGAWRYDHPDETAVWVHKDPDSGSLHNPNPRSVEDAKEDIINMFEGRETESMRRRREQNRQARKAIERWVAQAQIRGPEGEFVTIVDGAPKDEAFRMAREWMRNYSRKSDPEFDFTGGSI